MPQIWIVPSSTDLTDWPNAKSVIVNNSGNAATHSDYPVKLTVAFEPEMQSDFRDVRFSELGVVIPHWKESGTDGVSAVFWLKVGRIPGSSTRTLQMHYGNVFAADVSDAEAVFDLFDHFEVAPPGLWERSPLGPIMEGTEAFEDGFVRDAHVIPNPDYHPSINFAMWYWGTSDNLGFATSTDGLAFVRVTQLQLESGGTLQALRPCVVTRGGIYHLFFNSFEPDGVGRIYWTTSAPSFPSGVGDPEGPWSDPVMILEATEAWEGGNLWVASVIFDMNEYRWKMWYSADSHQPFGEDYFEPIAIGYATAYGDTIPTLWTKHEANPIITPPHDGSWQDSAIQGWEVALHDGIYHATYTAADAWGVTRVGYATSPSPTSWILAPSQLVLDIDNDGSFDQDFVYGSNPVLVNGLWRTYYNGRHTINETESLSVVMQVAGTLPNKLDTRKWWRSRGGPFVVDTEGSVLAIDSKESSLTAYGSDATLLSHDIWKDCMVEAKVQMQGSFTGSDSMIGLFVRSNGFYPNAAALNNPGTMSNYLYMLSDGSGGANQAKLNKWDEGVETTLVNVAQSVLRDTWYIQGLAAQGRSLRFFLNYTQLGQVNDSSLNVKGKVGLRAARAGMIVDWVRVRKYSFPEPTASVV